MKNQMGPKRGQVELTLHSVDIGNMVSLVADLDPEIFDNLTYKALIYRFKAAREETEKSEYDSYFLWLDEL